MSILSKAKKSLFNSTTVIHGSIGVSIFLVRLIKGWDFDKDEITGIVDNLIHLKGSFAGLFASFMVIFYRVKATKFDVSVFKTRTFWASMGKAAAIILTALGMGDDNVNIEEMAGSLFDSGTLLVATVTTVGSIYGRMKADKPVEIRKAIPVD